MEVEQYLDISNILKHLKKSEEIHIPKKRVGLEIQQTTRFYLPPQNKSLRAQYCHIYCVRFQNLSKRIKYNKNDPQYVELIQKIQNQPGIIKTTGTLFKEMKLKPYYFQSATQIKLANYVSDDDSCYLEDRSGRVKLIVKDCILHLPNEQRKISVDDLVTGLVVMIEGSIVANNVVKVEKMYLPQILESPMYKRLEQKAFACIISGINYNYQDNTSKLRHLIQYLQGNLYDGEGNEVAENLSQIIIAGNLYAPPDEQSDCLTGTMKMQQDFKQLYSKLQQNIKGVDELINQLVSLTPVAIMPGVNEPLSQMLPQGPLHKAHFSECFDQGNKLVFLTNPAEFELGNVKILGTSGQNIDDIKRYSMIKEQTDIDLIEMTLFYGHIAPTLPDTLIAYPQTTEDPFILDQFPNIYFAGNMSSFGTKKISDNLRIVSVPSFSATGIVCVVNLNTLECFPVTVQ